MDIELFKKKGFVYIGEYEFNEKYHTFIFKYNKCIIMIDDDFKLENNPDYFFDYSKYCDMQNSYVKNEEMVLRFNFSGDYEKINKEISDTFSSFESMEYDDNGGVFNKTHIDNSLTEYLFEDVFALTYGNDSLACLRKEEAVSAGGKSNYFIDYVLETHKGKFAFEENGVRYHHPLMVGKDKYNELLKKQNLITMLGYKVYRFSTENLRFSEKVSQGLMDFLPMKNEFIPKPVFKDNRGLVLYKHQTDILSRLDSDRLNGKSTALIVIPTASGKSEILIADLEKENIRKSVKRVLIIVPSVAVQGDWENRVKVIQPYYELIDIRYINTAYREKSSHPKDYYDYIIVDEAHHAPASTWKATIQYYNPKYLLGITATPDRLDGLDLRDIFGSFEPQMSLKEAIEKNIVSNVRVFRVESNIDLKEVRYNGKDYNSADLEKSLVVESRNELIADVLVKYFAPKVDFYKQGIIFCVNQKHAVKMAKILNGRNLSARAVYGGNRHNEESFDLYRERKIQFLCCCQMISEGWDSPQTEIIVMARPTLSKVLYMQQLGRGVRKYKGKECLYLLDVIDNYSCTLTPWNFNSLFGITKYSPFMGVINNNTDYLEIFGLSESELALKEVDIFTFEEKYKDYLSLEQAARELYIGTQTLNEWNKKNNYASLYLQVGSKNMPYFSSADIDKIRIDKGLTIHNNDTILADFNNFIDENTLTFSFKLIFLINSLKLADQEGNINLDDLEDKYAEFYLERIKKGLPVDRANCIYSKEYLSDKNKVKKSILENPFEKFERKRFFYHSKDLNMISFNPSLWNKLTDEIKNNIIIKEKEFLKEYYKDLGGYTDEYQF